jgi:hypothetical protein
MFRGEEAFAPDVTGWRRWSKPSPEPPLDETFRNLVLEAIQQRAASISGLVDRLARAMLPTLSAPPLLVAILRAGVPVGALLAQRLRTWLQAEVPLVALSLFAGIGWDAVALQAALQRHPGRPVWFVDGWTGRGRVARELQHSYQHWLQRGGEAFAGSEGPRLAVLCDPAGAAHACGVQADYFVPAACFTAPETLGFSRGFVREEPGMFRVYLYPRRLLEPQYLEAWLQIAHTPPDTVPCQTAEKTRTTAEDTPPPGYRIHSSEVARALINRAPREVLFRDDAVTVSTYLAPLQYLCEMRAIPMRYQCPQVAAWGTQVAACMGTEL